MKTRRHFVYLSLASLSISALHSLHAQRLGGKVFANSNVEAYQHGGLTQAVFEKHLGSLFTTWLDGDKLAYLRLETVTPVTAMPAAVKSGTAIAPAKPAIGITTFRLTFDTGGVDVPQGSYLVDHGVLGRFAIFLVPGLAQNERPLCSACFSSFTPA